MWKSTTLLKNSEEDLILNMVTVEQNPVSTIVIDWQPILSIFVTKNVIFGFFRKNVFPLGLKRDEKCITLICILHFRQSLLPFTQKYNIGCMENRKFSFFVKITIFAASWLYNFVSILGEKKTLLSP